MNLVIIFAVGIALGWLANILIEGHGLGSVGDISVATLGAFFAALIYSNLYIDHSALGFITIAILGAAVFLAPVVLFSNPKDRRPLV